MSGVECVFEPCEEERVASLVRVLGKQSLEMRAQLDGVGGRELQKTRQNTNTGPIHWQNIEIENYFLINI